MVPGWRQHLSIKTAPAGQAADAETAPARSVKHPGLTWYDHLVMLLHVAAEIEHGLMVQYLYAAYSLGGPDVTGSERQALVSRWQSSLLKVAKEEMGHLLTVQNILCLIGAPINLGREDYPWDVPYYPYPFSLEKLTRSSLACYVHAEMPPHLTAMLASYPHLSKRLREFSDKDKAEISRLIEERSPGASIHTVAAVYDEIVDILRNENLIPDSAFNEDSYRMQASWDDWGRGYRPDPHMLDASGSPEDGAPPVHQRQANVIILRSATRTQALAALKAISGQGEAIHLDPKDNDEPSHFERFLKIFQEFPEPGDWVPARDIAANPTTRKFVKTEATYIESAYARAWGTLFNYRYRLLLTCLAHSFRLAREEKAGEPNIRGVVMHRVFGEMYNLKTIAGILVTLDIRDPAAKASRKKAPQFAGPPFEMPYSLTLPDTNADTWRLHQELLRGSSEVCAQLLPQASGASRDYLQALIGLDRDTITRIESMLAGSGRERR